VARRIILLIGLLVILLFYAPVLLLPEDIMSSLTIEDGVFEYFGALCFFSASIIFLYNFLKPKKRNLFFMLFAIVFFFAAGEEIAWGQRILKYSIPLAIEAINAQNEVTVHNLNIFQHNNGDSGILSSIKSLINFNHIFILFWMTFCILLPFADMYSRKFRSLFKKISIPIISIWFGILFLFNELLCKTLELYMSASGAQNLRIYEIKESLWAFLVLLFSIYLLLHQPWKLNNYPNVLAPDKQGY
jgi:hypothetical protein